MACLTDEKSYNWIDELTENTTLMQYLSEIKNNILFDDMYKLYRDNIEQTLREDGERPFLTILIRTQGKREEGLREALLCVLAQTFSDYEVILIGHKVEEENKIIIQNILDDQQEEFRKKIRYIELNEGTRTTPLNVGFSLARGKYISVFDDDDILFDNWAEDFYNAARENDGKILHGYAFGQSWEAVKDSGYRAVNEPLADYCKDFDLLSQLVTNKCPLMTLAFPTYLFQKLGICFNEELNVMEDWEYFMRLSLVCGVADIQKPVAIYRFWSNIENSATLHDQKEWDQIYLNIRDNMGCNGFLFPKQYSEEVTELLGKRFELVIEEEDNKEKARLYYSFGDPFKDDMIIKEFSDCNLPKFNYWFPLKLKSKKLKAMRFDLSNNGLFLLEQINIEVYYSDGRVVEIPLKDCAHTGLHFFGKILFLHAYPEIVWQIEEEGYIECVHVSGKISRKVWIKSIAYRLFELLFSYKFLKKNREFHKKGWF